MLQYENHPPTPRNERPSVFWPVVLITLGVVLLLSNLGYLPAPSWTMAAKLWPVVFIALGIDLVIGRRSLAGAIISGILILALAAGVLVLVFFARQIPALAELAREPVLERHTISHPLGDIKRASLSLDWSSLSGTLEALDDSEQLLEGVISTTGTLDFAVDRVADGAEVRINTLQTTPVFSLQPGGSQRDEPWSLALNSRVRWDLNLDGGSGAFDFDLTGLDIEALALDGGSGAITLRLPATGDFEARIEGGSGAMTIITPENVGVRVVLDDGSGAFSMASRFERVGEDVWESEGYADAETKIVLRIDQGSGAVRVE